MKSDLKTLLKNIFLFEQLTMEQLESLAAGCSLVSCQKHQQLFREGQKAVAFYSLVFGQVKIYRISAEGTEHTLELHDPPNLIAEAAIFDRETYPASCKSLEDSLLLKITREVFVDLIQRNPSVSLKIMHAYSRRLRTMVKLIEGISALDIKARFAAYLLKNSRQTGDSFFSVIPVTKKELASILGTIPESLSRAISYFKRNNIISEEKQLIRILDLPRLKSHLK